MKFSLSHRDSSLPVLPYEKGSVLVAASVSQHKENPQDWSKPGEIYLPTPGENLTENWGSQLLDSGITRNNRMTKATFNGREALCVSGVEGIFALSSAASGGIEIKQIFGREVSEMAFVDLDGDGVLEMVTIEPFHGSALNIYKRIDGYWNVKFSDTLSFGHGLSNGMFNGEPVIVAGNRRDSLALGIFTIDNLDKGTVNRNVIEEEAGPTQTRFFMVLDQAAVVITIPAIFFQGFHIDDQVSRPGSLRHALFPEDHLFPLGRVWQHGNNGIAFCRYPGWRAAFSSACIHDRFNFMISL
ncbi:MAG: hypothetical protein V2B15_18705 [Bacteroidota bacterium]